MLFIMSVRLTTRPDHYGPRMVASCHMIHTSDENNLSFHTSRFNLPLQKTAKMSLMAMWSCDFENCGKPSVRTYGECIICDRHLCATHLGPEYHTCPKWEVSKTSISYCSLEGINQFFN